MYITVMFLLLNVSCMLSHGVDGSDSKWFEWRLGRFDRLGGCKTIQVDKVVVQRIKELVDRRLEAKSIDQRCISYKLKKMFDRKLFFFLW